MRQYIIKRLFLIFPTLLGILLINFMIIQFAPGGPVEKILSTLNNHNVFQSDMINQGSLIAHNNDNKYMGSEGLDKDILQDIKQQYGFDKPLHIRFLIMLKQFVTFDFG